MSKCVEYCAADLRPFESISGKGFLSLAQSLIDLGSVYGEQQAADVITHPTTVSRRLGESAELLRVKILPDIIKALENGTIAATTDMWTDDFKKARYTTLTVQLIDDSWNLKSHVLFTCSFPLERKTGNNIAKELFRRFTKVGLSVEQFKKLRFVTDRGANIIKALENHTRFSCICHLINTILYHTFKSELLQQNCPDIYYNLADSKSLRFLNKAGV